jgi:hypothetical protein
MGFFDDFMGYSQRDDLQNASQSANSYLDRGLTSFTDISKEYADKALGQFSALDPYINAGNDSLSLLRNALGLNGQDAGKSFFQNLMQDPAFIAQRDAGVDAADASAASRGMLRSGGQQRDLFSFGNRFFGDFANNRMGQLTGLFNTGAGINTSATGAKAGLLSGLGDNLANAELGTNQLKASGATGLGNAMAQSRSTGINNLLGVGNMLAGFFKPSPTYNFGKA